MDSSLWEKLNHGAKPHNNTNNRRYFTRCLASAGDGGLRCSHNPVVPPCPTHTRNAQTRTQSSSRFFTGRPVLSLITRVPQHRRLAFHSAPDPSAWCFEEEEDAEALWATAPSQACPAVLRHPRSSSLPAPRGPHNAWGADPQDA